ncbi:MAG: FHA domain-containing protein [Myxococcaceae bacterium]
MRPSARPVTAPQAKPVARPAAAAPARPAAPIPASELVKRPAPAAKPALATAGAPRFGLAVVAGPARGQRFRLPSGGAIIGKSRGAILFPDDPYLSPQHATVGLKDGRLFVRDDGSASGVFVSISGQETIPSNSFFSTGSRLFRYAGAVEPAPPFVPGQVTSYGAPVPQGQVMYRVEEMLVGGREGLALVSAGPIVTIGQTRCDLSFPHDEGLAPRHCELSPMPTGAMIRDLSGGLGTFVRLSLGTDRQLKPGDRLRVGQNVLQVEAIAG